MRLEFGGWLMIRFRLRTLLLVVAVLAVTLAVLRKNYIKPHFSMAGSRGNVVYAVRTGSWPNSKQTLEFVLFVPRNTANSNVRVQQRTLRDMTVYVDGGSFTGHIMPTHTVWRAVAGRIEPVAEELDLVTLKAYLSSIPQQDWSVDSLQDYADNRK